MYHFSNERYEVFADWLRYAYKILVKSDTSNQNNCNRMVSTTDQIYNRIRKHLSYYTKTIIHLGLSEYCWRIPWDEQYSVCLQRVIVKFMCFTKICDRFTIFKSE